MSSPDERAFPRVGYCSADGEQTGVSRRGPRVPRGRSRGLVLEEPRSGQGEGGFQGSRGFGLEPEVREAVLGGREERPGTPVKDDGDDDDEDQDDDYRDGKGDPLAVVVRFAEKPAATVVQRQVGRDAWCINRMSPPETCWVQVPPLWVAHARGAPAQSCVEVPEPSGAPLHLRGQAWRGPRRGSRGRLNVPGDWRWPSAEGLGTQPSDTESSDDISDLQMMRMRIYAKEVDPASTSSPEDARELALPSNFLGREDLCYLPGSSVPSAPQGVPSVVERQTVARRDTSPDKQMPDIVWGKGRGRPSCSGAGLPGSLPGTGKKEIQERKCLGSPSKMALGRIFPSWGQRVSAVSPEPASFPPIAGVPLLGPAKRLPKVPLSAKPPKPPGAGGKKFVARKPREREQVAGEDEDADRDPVSKDQLPTPRPGPSSQSVHRRERSSGGDLDIRGLQVSGISLPLAPSQGYTMPRGPAHSSDREPPDHPPRPERQQQPPAGQGCPRCVVLQKEIDNLKEQLAILRSLAYKFWSLSG